jgi:L-fuculose-phosphate aldolase
MDMDALASEMTKFMMLMTETGLCHLRGGNCAVRVADDEFVLTRHQTAKEKLGREHLVAARIWSDDDVPDASVNVQLHRQVFRRTDARVVLHGHPYHAALLSYFQTEIWPLDENSLSYIGSPIRVVAAEGFKQWKPIESELADALCHVPAVVLRWHGGYTIGKDFGEAFNRMQALDQAARFIIDVERLGAVLGPPRLPPYAASQDASRHTQGYDSGNSG